MLIIFFKTRYFLARFCCCMFTPCVQKWNGGLFGQWDLFCFCSGKTWKGKGNGVSRRTLYQEVKRGRAGLSVAAYSKSSLFAVGGNSIFYVYCCHMMTMSEKQSYSKVDVYLSPCPCLNTCKSKWFSKKNMNCKCQHPFCGWLHLKLLLVLVFMAKLKKFVGVQTLFCWHRP